nr:restriction endonuclease subunit S [Pseudomonadota bacterium]
VDGATRGSEGTRMPRAKWDYVSGFQSPITDKKEQKAIADILSNLDDKIEINQQMNQTLESIAQTLFKSWFIDFDPVKAKMEGRVPKGMDADLLALFPDSFEDSELEPIPKGWEVKELGHVVKIKQGKYRKDIFIKPEETASTPLWGGNGIRGYISECDLHEPTTFITCRGAGCGFIQKSLEPSSFSNSVIALCNIPNKSVFTFIYNYSLLSNFSAFITGSAQPQITIGNLEKHQLVLPNFKIQQYFNTITEHIYQKILSLDMQIATLTETRDALLPKLLSGELRVNDVEA